MGVRIELGAPFEQPASHVLEEVGNRVSTGIGGVHPDRVFEQALDAGGWSGGLHGEPVQKREQPNAAPRDVGGRHRAAR